jgi:NTE family protein
MAKTVRHSRIPGLRRSDLAVGVALSAGGAAAMAQVGVLEELTAAGISVRAVAGTSAGAMVGAAFAAGHLEPFRDLMCGLTRRRVLWLFDPQWPRSGLLEGRYAMELIRPYVGARIETLPRRYAAVATDLASGAEVMLREGDVLEAIRASVAIPGIFKPRRHGGRLLVDGGLVNPVPVSVARALGADLVIAVSVLVPIPLTWRPGAVGVADRRSLAGPLLGRFLSALGAGAPAGDAALDQAAARVAAGEIGLIEVLLQASRVVESRIAADRLRVDPPDVLVTVPVPKVGLFDFHRSRELVETGRAAGRRALPEIRAALGAAMPLHRRVGHWLRRGAGRAEGT